MCLFSVMCKKYTWVLYRWKAVQHTKFLVFCLLQLRNRDKACFRLVWFIIALFRRRLHIIFICVKWPHWIASPSIICIQRCKHGLFEIWDFIFGENSWWKYCNGRWCTYFLFLNVRSWISARTRESYFFSFHIELLPQLANRPKKCY